MKRLPEKTAGFHKPLCHNIPIGFFCLFQLFFYGGTGTCKLSGLEGTPKGIYVQIELSEQGKAESPMDNPAKNNKRMNLC